MAKRQHVIVNAIHTKTGGGLVYINHILPFLADAGFKVTVLAAKGFEHKINLIEGVNLQVLNVPKNFIKMHLWEQFVLPFKMRKMNYSAMLCNANYVPVLVRNTLPIVHNNPSVGLVDKRFKNVVYWKVLIGLTRFSVLVSKKAFIVAEHAISQYASGVFSCLAQKFVVAHPACVDVTKTTKLKRTNYLAVGDFYIQKNYLFLLNAFAEFKKQSTSGEKLIIVGRPVDREVYRQVLFHVEKLGLKNCVEIIQGLPHADLIKFMQASKLYLNTSSVECFNMPVLEAMATGTPTVVLDYDFQHEVAGDSVCYVRADQDVHAWANSMLKLDADENFRNELAEKGVKRSQSFTWEATAQVIVNVIKELK